MNAPSQPESPTEASRDILGEALLGVEQGLAQLRRMQKDADALRLSLIDQQTKATERERELTAQSEALAQSQEALEAERARHKADQDALAELADAQHAQAVQLQERVRDLEERERKLSDEASGARHEQDELAKRAQELGRQQETFRKEQGETASLRQALKSVQQQASQTLSALQEATTRAEKSEEAFESLRTQAESLAQNQSDAQAQGDRRVTELEAVIADLRSHHKLARHQESQAAGAIDDLKRQLAESSASESILRDQARHLAEQVAAQSEKGTASASALAGELSSSRERETRAQETIAARERELADARVILDDLRHQVAQSGTDTGELESVLNQLRDRLKTEGAKADAYREQVRTLEERLAQSPAPVSSSTTVPSDLRRRRMAKARTLIRARADKVRKAGDVLSNRFEQCEKILAMRQEVLAAKRSVEAAHRKEHSGDARSKAASTFFFAAAGFGVIAFMSWLAAGKIAPEVYAAKVTFLAQSKDRDLSDAELGEWRGSVESMLTDPRFAQFAGDRMKAQGIMTLAAAPALSARLKSDSSLVGSNPGELTLELRGAGKARTERELQIIATAVMSEAREARERSVQGATTIIREPAQAPDEPVESLRLFYAGALSAIACVVFSILAAIVWVRLAHAKLQFDASTSVESLERDQRWPDSRAA